jgi:type IV pilus assembly protein PilV
MRPHPYRHDRPDGLLTRPAPRGTASRRQRGFSIIEVLMSILIFSGGLLGIAGLYANAARSETGAEFRTTAAMLANDLIGRMWMSDRTAATLQASFGSAAAGTGYTSWLAAVTGSGLPGAAAQPPTVTFSTVSGGGSSAVSSSVATITIFWQGPGDTAAHQYVALAQMKP